MEILIKTLQFLLSLSILIIIHEYGHFLFARLFKVRVEKFYLFFNPWFSLFKVRRGETEYGMGWLPLGGYVKIAGMIDESMDKEQMKQPAKPWEFRSKPAWQRLLVMIGGVLFNIALAALIYVFMLFIIGEEYLPVKNLKYGIVAEPLGKEIGLQTGDHILALNGEEVGDWMSMIRSFARGEVSEVTVLRDGQIEDLTVPEDFFGKLISARGSDFISIRFPFIVDGFLPDSPGEKAGVKVGDHIKGIGGNETWSFTEFAGAIGEYAGQETTLTVERNGETLVLDIAIPERAMIGAYRKDPFELLSTETKAYSFVAAIPAGAVKAFTTTRDYFRDLRLLFRPEVSARDSLGGFITIGGIFSPTWDWVHFWTMTAFLSIILAVMNILPIPALDGGHVMFLFYEIIVGKKPPDKFMEYAQMVGMILLLSLILLVNLNDVLRLFR
ncbi:MAG: RIP metalloprotease RseP [Bacteroidales bacterium]|nr:RIP metalloprotease RseP [Bacteroidales bacterium]